MDPSDLVYSSMDSAHTGQPVNLIGIVVHVLSAGGVFDTVTRMATAPALLETELDLGES